MNFIIMTNERMSGKLLMNVRLKYRSVRGQFYISIGHSVSHADILPSNIMLLPSYAHKLSIGAIFNKNAKR